MIALLRTTLLNVGHFEDQDAVSPDRETESLYRSLLEHVVDYVGKDSVLSVVVHADPLIGGASVDICLEDDSYERFSAAVERMGEIQSMYMDELAIEYVLTAGEPHDAGGAPNPTKELVYA